MDAGRVTELSIGLKGDLAQTSDMVKQVNDKLIASLPIAEAVTLMNNTKTNFEKKNALFLSKLKEANLNIEQWNVVAGSMLTSMDSLDTVKNDFATVYTAYESGVKGTADEKAELKTAADGLSKLIVSFWDQLRIAGFKKTDEK
ncbi:MAG: hypothetical protein A2Y33_10140 [Spirochaetes bacterium GWF1_51_8]|nr:MAG: hypothetical protein A2Y33_10140 [Spirochaetes bacterium GWF1_51_8]